MNTDCTDVTDYNSLLGHELHQMTGRDLPTATSMDNEKSNLTAHAAHKPLLLNELSAQSVKSVLNNRSV